MKAEDWVSVDYALPEMETPVIGAFEDGDWYIFMRSEMGGEGWLWYRLLVGFGFYHVDNPLLNDWECDDDYEIRWWLPVPERAPKVSQGCIMPSKSTISQGEGE